VVLHVPVLQQKKQNAELGHVVHVLVVRHLERAQELVLQEALVLQVRRSLVGTVQQAYSLTALAVHKQ
jgi:hypothetical protein